MPYKVLDVKNTKLPEGTIYDGKKLVILKGRQIVTPLILTLNSFEKLTIEAEESSEIKIIVEINNQLTEKLEYNLNLVLKPNSNVTYLLASELVSEDVLINHNFSVENDATLNLMAGFLNNKAKAHLNTRLVGVGSTVNIRAVVISAKDNNQLIDVEINHEAKRSTGLMHNIAIAGDNGRVVLNGVERILQGNNNSDAYQSLNGITTSNEAVIEVNPILLIDEYDITAGHGATVGKLDEVSIYYLMSRGLTRKESEKLMINGLIRPLVDEISDEEIKNRFIDVVNSRL